MFLSLLTKKWKGFLFWAVSFLLVSLLPVFSMRETTTLVTFFITDAWAFPVSLIGGPLYLVLFLGGEFLRLFFMGTSADLSYAMALAKAVGALAGWWICKKIRFNAKLPTLRDVLIFFAIVSFVVLPIAGLLTAALSLAFNSQLGFLYHFLNVYMGAIIPLEVFGAVYLVFATHPKWSMSDIFVSLALFLGTAALSMFVLGRFFAFGYASIEIMIVLVPLALVVGLKRGLLGAAAFHLGLTVAFIETSASGFGPFQINLIPNSVGALIMFVNGLLTLNFMISALFLENQEARRSVEAFDKKNHAFC